MFFSLVILILTSTQKALSIQSNNFAMRSWPKLLNLSKAGVVGCPFNFSVFFNKTILVLGYSLFTPGGFGLDRIITSCIVFLQNSILNLYFISMYVFWIHTDQLLDKSPVAMSQPQSVKKRLVEREGGNLSTEVSETPTSKLYMWIMVETGSDHLGLSTGSCFVWVKWVSAGL